MWYNTPNGGNWMLKDINLNLYKTFLAVYETKNISKAGKKCL